MQFEAAVGHAAASKQVRMLQHFFEGQLEREREKGRIESDGVRHTESAKRHKAQVHMCMCALLTKHKQGSQLPTN